MKKTKKIQSPLAENLARALAVAGLTGAEASRAAGLGRTFCADILSGKARSPSAGNLHALARILKITAAQLTGEQPYPAAALGRPGSLPGSLPGLLADRQADGSWRFVIPADSGEAALKLLQLYLAAAPDQRQRALLHLQHGGLTAGTDGPQQAAAPIQEAELEALIESGLNDVAMDRLQRVEAMAILFRRLRQFFTAEPEDIRQRHGTPGAPGNAAAARGKPTAQQPEPSAAGPGRRR